MLAQTVRRMGLAAGLSMLLATAPAVDGRESGAIRGFIAAAIADQFIFKFGQPLR